METTSEAPTVPSRRSFAVVGLTQFELHQVQSFINELRRRASAIEDMSEEHQSVDMTSHKRALRAKRKLTRQRLRLRSRRK